MTTAKPASKQLKLRFITAVENDDKTKVVSARVSTAVAESFKAAAEKLKAADATKELLLSTVVEAAMIAAVDEVNAYLTK